MNEALETLTVITPDMSCGHCVSSIQGDVSELAGVESVVADLPSKGVTIVFNPATVTVAQIEAKLDDAGYPVAR